MSETTIQVRVRNAFGFNELKNYEVPKWTRDGFVFIRQHACGHISHELSHQGACDYLRDLDDKIAYHDAKNHVIAALYRHEQAQLQRLIATTSNKGGNK